LVPGSSGPGETRREVDEKSRGQEKKEKKEDDSAASGRAGGCDVRGRKVTKKGETLTGRHHCV